MKLLDYKIKYNYIKLFPARESLACDISAGDRKIANLFYTVGIRLCEYCRGLPPSQKKCRCYRIIVVKSQ
jgi:hypothetical protein